MASILKLYIEAAIREIFEVVSELKIDGGIGWEKAAGCISTFESVF